MSNRFIQMGIKGVFKLIIDDGKPDERNVKCVECKKEHFTKMEPDELLPDLTKLRCIFCCRIQHY